MHSHEQIEADQIMSAAVVKTGRANAVFVAGYGDSAVAALSSVLVRARAVSSRRRLVFVGPAMFDDAVRRHVRRVILPIIDQIADALRLPRHAYEVSVVNLGAASSSDLGMRITGFSADTAVFLAALSATLAAPIPEDFVSTGHIASVAGDIRPVRSLASKLQAIALKPSITHILCPHLDDANSMKVLSPKEFRTANDALAEARTKLKVTTVDNLFALCQATFTEEALALASLESGFFDTVLPVSLSPGPVGQLARYLLDGNPDRFWRSLDRALLCGDNSLSQTLLDAHIRFWTMRKHYPKDFGQHLRRCLQSLPPATRRVKVRFPLCDQTRCLHLTHFTDASDYEDVVMFLDTVAGKRLELAPSISATDSSRKDASDPDDSSVLDTVLAAISPETLAANVGCPIDAARASYIMDSVTTASRAEFDEAYVAFYLHLARHCRGVNPLDVDSRNVSAEALALLETAFIREGGYNAARAEAEDCCHGGLRYIYDRMTDAFKIQEMEKRVNLTLIEALDPRDWDAKVAFVTQLIERLRPSLPTPVLAKPPEAFAREAENLAKAYVQSMDTVRNLLRSI